MILQEILNKTIQFFKDKNFESARLDAEILISNALGLKRIELYTNFERTMKEEELVKCRENVKRRITGEPVAYIIGSRAFYRHDFIVDKNVLIPRPETETLIDEVLKFVLNKEKDLKILDLGTGSGAIACTLASEFKNAKVTAMDISEGAIFIAKQNAEKIGVQGRIDFITADASEFDVSADENIFAGMDIIVSNPPYISLDDTNIDVAVKKFEPASALFAGENGTLFIQKWAKRYVPILGKPGLMIFEIGRTQGEIAQKIFSDLKIFDSVEIVKDLSGNHRFIKGIRHG